MVKTITAPTGMSALQAIHALVKYKSLDAHSYKKEARDVHYLLCTFNHDSSLIQAEVEKLIRLRVLVSKDLAAKIAQKKAAKLVYAFAKNLFSKGQFTLESVFEKQIKVDFTNFPTLDVAGFDGIYGKGAAESALNTYSRLDESRKIHHHLLEDDVSSPPIPTLEQFIQPKHQKSDANGTSMEVVAFQVLSTIAIFFAAMKIDTTDVTRF